MKLFRKVVDERQELEMMRVERGGFWIMFFVLAVAITVQVFVFDFNFRHVAGESIVLTAGAVWVLIGDIRRGSWDYFTKPGMKSYVVYSLAGGFLFSLPMPLTRYFRHGIPFLDCIWFFVINFVFLFPITFLMLWFVGSIAKKRQKKLEQEYGKEE